MLIKIKPRLKRRSILIISTISFLTVSALLAVYFQITSVKKVYAATNYYTLSDGEWGSSVWSNTTAGGVNCTCNPGGNFNKIAYITKNITVSSYSPFKLSGGGSVYISTNGRLTFNSNIEFSGGSLMTIDSLDSVIVNGNLLLSSSSIDVKGYFRVNGNATLTGGSSVCGTGFALLNGTLTGTTWCGGIVLPITLLSFNAKVENNLVKLFWTTASEINNDYFTVQRSRDGIQFEDILKVNGYGNSTRIINYAAFDNLPDDEITFYRLKQTDYDGKSSYGNIKSISAKLNRKAGLEIQSIGPVPFDDTFNMEFNVSHQTEVNVIITNFTGQVVYQEKMKVVEGKNVFTFNNSKHISSGTYIVRLVGGDEMVGKKIVKS